MTKSLLRFSRWQVYHRFLSRKPLVVPFIGSTRIELQKQEHAALGNWYYGLSEFEMMSFVLHFLRSKDYFVDVGANIGSYTILASGICGAQSTAFEPVPETFKKLQNHVQLNQLATRVDLFQMGLSDKPGQLHFTTNKGQQNHMVESRRHTNMAISSEVSTLDLQLKDFPTTLLKIDVEGYEMAILRGGLETLKKPGLKAVIIETMGLGSRYGFDEQKIHQQLRTLGFRTFEYLPFDRKLKPSSRDGGQVLYLRDYEMVKERIESAIPFEIFGQKI